MFSSIRSKLLLTYLLLVLVGTGSLATYVLSSFHNFYLTRIREELRLRATAVAVPTGEALARRDRRRLADVARMFALETHLTFRVFDDRVNLLVSSRVPLPDKPPWIDLPGMREAARGVLVSGIMPDRLPRSEKLYVVMPVQQGQRRLGYVRMSLLLGEFQRVFNRVQMAVIFGLLGTVAGCVALSLILARGLSEPIRQMAAFAEGVGAGRVGARLEIRATGEIARLGAALNRMSEQLARNEEERRQFLTAASHELRTPAANIQVTLEALLAGADANPTLRENFLRAGLRESERLSQLVRDVFDLARLEAGGLSLAAAPVRLADVIARARDAMEPRLQECSLVMEVDGGDDLWVRGDADRLLQMLTNLLDNAVRFSGPKCAIRISVTACDQEAELEVEDNGAGIPEQDLPFVFDRFYTADKSRARDHGGTGLGLALVKQIVEAHGGHVEAANIPCGGARFTVRLPRCER